MSKGRTISKTKTAKKRRRNLKTSPAPLYRSQKTKRDQAPQNDFATSPRKLSAADWSRIREEQLAIPFFEAARTSRREARPFLKWAGGKASLLSQLEQFFPETIDRYIEPFLGGRAVFFHLKHRFPQMRAFLRDSNKELINCYRVVRDRPVELMRWLDHHAKTFRSHGADYYYLVRKEHDLTDDLARTARTIFLNKTCFNGLFRVNARGEFNTPVGSSKAPSLYDRENLLAA